MSPAATLKAPAMMIRGGAVCHGILSFSCFYEPTGGYWVQNLRMLVCWCKSGVRYDWWWAVVHTCASLLDACDCEWKNKLWGIQFLCFFPTFHPSRQNVKEPYAINKKRTVDQNGKWHAPTLVSSHRIIVFRRALDISNPASLENCSLQPHQHRLRNSNTPVTR